MSCLTTTFATVNAVKADFAPRGADRVVAAAVLAIESGLAVIGTALFVVAALSTNSGGAGMLLGLALLAGLAAAGLFFLARGLWQGRRWAVSPSITWQVLQGVVAAASISSARPLLGVIALAIAAIGLVALILVARSAASRG